jgi:hypothetical protein
MRREKRPNIFIGNHRFARIAPTAGGPGITIRENRCRMGATGDRRGRPMGDAVVFSPVGNPGRAPRRPIAAARHCPRHIGGRHPADEEQHDRSGDIFGDNNQKISFSQDAYMPQCGVDVNFKVSGSGASKR